jgi:hypothetical protein
MAKSKSRRKPVHRRVEGINYIIYANGDVRQDRRGGKRPGSGRKALAPEKREFHSIKITPGSASILNTLSAKFSRHRDYKVTQTEIVTLIVHRAEQSKGWMSNAFSSAQVVPAGEDPIRIRQLDYEKLLKLKEALLTEQGTKLTTTKLFNVLINLVGSQLKSMRV